MWPTMLDLRHVVDNLEAVRASLRTRSEAAAAPLSAIQDLARKRRDLIGSVEAKQAERNAANDAMAKADKKGPEFAARRDELKGLSGAIKALEAELASLESEIHGVLAVVPNLPDPSVPHGGGAEDNQVVRVWGEAPVMAFEPKPHFELGPALGIIDFERAAKLSGSRFTILNGAAAKLERALIRFMLKLHTEVHGYTETLPPFLVKGSALYGTGQFPKMKEDVFETSRDVEGSKESLYLIPTAEVPVTNYYAGEILDGAQLPIAFTAYTPCFRSEAGSHGRDVRGLIRQHQFDKVELVRFVTPETSHAQHELLTSHAEEVLKRLKLHFRTVLLCTGDQGFSSQKTYDLEVWLPSERAFREISSCSNFGDFQARRANIRYRSDAKAKPVFLHTLNGSALAVGRTLIAILDQYQQADGSVVVPEALREEMGCDVIRAAR